LRVTPLKRTAPRPTSTSVSPFEGDPASNKILRPPTPSDRRGTCSDTICPVPPADTPVPPVTGRDDLVTSSSSSRSSSRSRIGREGTRRRQRPGGARGRYTQARARAQGQSARTRPRRTQERVRANVGAVVCVFCVVDGYHRVAPRRAPLRPAPAGIPRSGPRDLAASPPPHRKKPRRRVTVTRVTVTTIGGLHKIIPNTGTAACDPGHFRT